MSSPGGKLASRSLPSALGAVGMAIGTAVLLMSLSIQGGLLATVDTAISEAPNDLVRIQTGTGLQGGLTQADVAVIRGLESVSMAAAESFPWLLPGPQAKDSRTGALLDSFPYLEFSFRAVSPEYFLVREWPLLEGRGFGATNGSEAVIGVGLVERLGAEYRAGKEPVLPTIMPFGEKQPLTWEIGSIVKFPEDPQVQDFAPPSFRDQFEVVGILAPVKESYEGCPDCFDPEEYFGVLATSPNYTIFVPEGRLPSRFGRFSTKPWRPGQPIPPVTESPPPNEYYAAWARPRSGAYQQMREDVTRTLRARLGERPVEFMVESLTRSVFVKSRDNIAKGFALVALAILIVALLNVTNACAVWVLQRVRELGIRRANGASRLRIQLMVLVQAARLVALGGGTGVLLGFALRPLGEEIIGNRLTFRASTMLAVLAILGIGAVIAAVYPARAAAHLTPASSISGAAALGGSRFRKLIAVTGVAVGVAALTVVAALSAGTQSDLRRLLSAVGNDVLEVRAQDPFEVGATPRLIPTFEDVPVLRSVLGPDQTVAGWSSRRTPVSFGDQTEDVDLVVATEALPSILGFELGVGQLPSLRDQVVIGDRLATTYFGSPTAAIGKTLKVVDLEFAVVGVWKPRPASVLDMGPDRDGMVLVLPEARQELGVRLGALPEPVLLVQAGGDPKATEAVIRSYFEERSGAGLVPAIRAPVGQLELLAQARRRLAAVFATLSLLSLGLGTAGVATVLLALAIERRREIGIRRVAGARRAAIFRSTIAEAIALCVGAGLVGLLLAGGVISWAVAVNAWPPALPVAWALFGLLAAVGSGVAAGLVPAYWASALSPAAAIRE